MCFRGNRECLSDLAFISCAWLHFMSSTHNSVFCEKWALLKDVNNLLFCLENLLFQDSGGKKNNNSRNKKTNRVEAWVLKLISTSWLFFSPCSNSRQLQASTDDSYISIVLHFYLTLSFFHFCQLLLRNWRRVWCRLTVVGLGLYDFVPFFSLLLSPPRFPPRLINAPLPSQIRWCCRYLPSTKAASRDTQTHRGFV